MKVISEANARVTSEQIADSLIEMALAMLCSIGV